MSAVHYQLCQQRLCCPSSYDIAYPRTTHEHEHVTYCLNSLQSQYSHLSCKVSSNSSHSLLHVSRNLLISFTSLWYAYYYICKVQHVYMYMYVYINHIYLDINIYTYTYRYTLVLYIHTYIHTCITDATH